MEKVKGGRGTLFLAREIFELEKCKLDGRPSGFGIPYRFYVGIKTEFFDSIEQKRAFDSLGEDLGGKADMAFYPISLPKSPAGLRLTSSRIP